MAQINVINNKSGALTVDSLAATNSYTQFNINTTAKYRTGSKTSDNSFAISQGSALGTNDVFRITSGRQRTLPLTAAFNANYTANAVNDVTGDGTVYTLLWDNERIDQNGNFSGGTFTAPVTGRYRFATGPWNSAASTSAFTSQNIIISTSNRDYYGVYVNPFQHSAQQSSVGQGSNPLSVLADMDSGDTCVIKIVISGSTKTVDIMNAGSTQRTFNTGSLIC